VRLARLVQLGIDIQRNPGSDRPPCRIDGLSLVERDEKTGAGARSAQTQRVGRILCARAVAMILAMIVMVGSAPMLQSVTQDKSQRIVETLLGAASPLRTDDRQSAGFGWGLGDQFPAVRDRRHGSGERVGSRRPAAAQHHPVVLRLTCLTDVVMLCAFAAALGACCSTPQDAQNLAIVLLMPCLIPMFMLVTVLRQPNGMLATVLSLAPPFTPILMLLRQAMPSGVPAWQPWAGLAGVLVFAAGTVWAASRIFRVAILIQGKPPRLAEMVHWALRG
jgi:ABC-2 type transport system permease protein